MKRRFFAICSVFIAAIVLVALVPGCNGGPTTGTIVVDATLNSLPWSGAVEYTLTGPGATAPTIINGSSVSNNHTGEAGNWTCGYVSGGPPGANFVDITPSPAQSLSAGGTIGFTLNFETPPPPDASVEFKTWTINGQPVDPAQGPFPVGPGDWVDVEYEEHVSGGTEGEVVTVHQTSWLSVHNQGPVGDLLVTFDSIWLHVVNAPGAVSMDPPAEGKSNQQATVEGVPKNHCDEVELPYCEPVNLDVEVDWELKICTNYTKTINWIGFPEAGPMILVENGAEVLFEPSMISGLGEQLTLISHACVQMEGDENQENDCTDPSPTLTIDYVGPPLPPLP